MSLFSFHYLKIFKNRNRHTEKANRYLYYTSADTAKTILDNGTLKFSLPKTYNDPYDCYINVTFEDIENECLQEFISNLAKNKPDIWGSWYNQVKLFPLELIILEFKEQVRQAIVRNSKEKIYCHCLSRVKETATNKLSIPLFSYYGDKHQGVCLEFNDNLFSNKNLIEPVQLGDIS